MERSVYHGDCREVLKGLPDNSVDSVVTDPPYELGMMCKKWDSTGIAYDAKMWAEVLRVLKPGGHLLSFGGTRTYHRMACAIEDAGFEIRDQIQWLYGQGFPKSQNVGKAMDKQAGAEREIIGTAGSGPDMRGSNFKNAPEGVRVPTNIIAPSTDEAKKWDGWGTALKPANEPIVLARKPLSEKTVAANVLKWGTGALNIDISRIAYQSEADKASATPQGACTSKDKHVGAEPDAGNNEERIGFERPEQKGRWPANVITDGSDEVLESFPDAPGQLADASLNPERRKNQNVYGAMRVGCGEEPSADSENEGVVGFKMRPGMRRLDAGSAARFFYVAKASKSDRGEGNTHATVKPQKLIGYLITLVTQSGGTVLDPFLGSGTTAVAAKELGMGFIGIEKEAEHIEIIKRRLGVASA